MRNAADEARRLNADKLAKLEADLARGADQCRDCVEVFV